MKVGVSASLSSNYDKRHVDVDEGTGEVLDDAQGYGYKSAQNTAIVTGFAGRLYGQRSAQTKRLRAAVAAETERGDGA